MANKWHFLPATHTPYRNIPFGVSKYSTIVSNRTKRSELMDRFFIHLVAIGYFANASYNNLRRKRRNWPDRIIAIMMKFDLIKNLVIECYRRNVIANFIRLLYGFYQQFSLLIIRQKLYFKSQFHNANIHNISYI